MGWGGGREEEAKTGKLQHQVFKPTPGSGWLIRIKSKWGWWSGKKWKAPVSIFKNNILTYIEQDCLKYWYLYQSRILSKKSQNRFTLSTSRNEKVHACVLFINIYKYIWFYIIWGIWHLSCELRFCRQIHQCAKIEGGVPVLKLPVIAIRP